MHRTYPLKHHINQGKQNQILAMLKEYRLLAKQIVNKQWCLFNTKGKFDKNYITKFYNSILGTAYRQNCQREEFKCKCCGKKIHADINGAKNIVTRNSNNEISIYTSKKEVLKIITRNYLERRGGYDSLPKHLKYLIDSNRYYKSTA